jgi:putative NADPH-quinone reductase
VATLVVQAHPLEDSYNAALRAAVCRGLESAGSEYTLARLWCDEHPTAAQLADSSRLILVYPTWWGGQPAMLLDWLQRMLAANAFGSVARFEAATTHGSSKLINRVQGEWGRRFLAERVAAACKPRTELEWHALYKIDRRTPAEIAAFLADTEQRFAATLLPAR